MSGADIVFLATPFSVNQKVIEGLTTDLEGKILIDCNNPVGRGITHGLNNERSGAEFIQSLISNTQVIKAFSIYGYENLKNNQYSAYNTKSVMMFCGDSDTAKAKDEPLIESLDWQPLDVGGLCQALHLEHMTLMWVRMVRMNKKSPHLVWAALQRTV